MSIGIPATGTIGKAAITPETGMILKVGKRKFARIVC
jgi:hypothetical protein